MSKSIEVHWDDSKARAVVHGGGEKAMWHAGNYLLDESRKQVPIDTGTLQRSGAVDAKDLSATVSYDTPYAVRQHEGVNYHHQRGRKAKYLEDPCNDSGIRNRILEYLKAELNF